jgi:hypothetical protein
MRAQLPLPGCAGFLPILLAAILIVPVSAQEKKVADPRPGTKVPVPLKSGPPSKSSTAAKNGIPTRPTVKKVINPKRIRVFLMDGSVIAGELSVESLEVATEFGKLTVPVTKILSITPGLDSHTKLSAQIRKLVESLGDDDYKTREQAHKDLLAMGPSVRDVIADYTEDKNAERKRHAAEIVKKFDEMQESAIEDADSDSPKPRKLVRYDIVETATFTIAGRISPSAFQVASKYGPLKVSLNDIKKTQREFVGKESISRKLSVPGQNLVLRSPKSSGIRVSAGDTITVSASGQVVMSPWGSNSITGPDGSSNYGSYAVGGKTYFGGALLARIGDSGNYEKVGSRHRWVAKKSGTLYFGIAVNPSYASSSYYYPGNYNLRIKVDPKQ